MPRNSAISSEVGQNEPQPVRKSKGGMPPGGARVAQLSFANAEATIRVTARGSSPGVNPRTGNARLRYHSLGLPASCRDPDSVRLTFSEDRPSARSSRRGKPARAYHVGEAKSAFPRPWQQLVQTGLRPRVCCFAMSPDCRSAPLSRRSARLLRPPRWPKRRSRRTRARNDQFCNNTLWDIPRTRRCW